MLKLTIRNYWLGVAGIAATQAAVFLLNGSWPASLIELFFPMVVLAQFLLAFIFAGIVYRNCSINEVIRAAYIMFFLGCTYAALDNLLFQQTRLLPGQILLFNFVQLSITTFGGILTTILLYKLAPESSSQDRLRTIGESSTNLQALSSSAWPAVGTQTGELPALSSSATNLPVVDAGSATSEFEAGTTSEVQGITSEHKLPEGSISSTRLQAQKRKSTSTFTKLQALSASGTGALHPKQHFSEITDEMESLKSILDRLDSKAEGASADAQSSEISLGKERMLLSDEELALAAGSIAEPPTHITGDQNAVPPAKPSFESTSPLANQLSAQITPPPLGESPVVNQTPAASSPSIPPPPTTPPPAIPPEPTKPQPANRPQLVTGPTGSGQIDSGAPSLADLLDAIETPSVLKDKANPPALAPSKPEKEKAGPGGLGASKMGKAAAKKVGTSGGVSQLGTTSGIHSIMPAETEAESRAPEPTSEPYVPQPTSDLYASPTSELAASPIIEPPVDPKSLFGAAVDEDIDEIFANLVPSDAQKDVPSVSGQFAALEPPQATVPAAENPLTTEIEIGKPTLFDAQLDKELDDVFSNLVPTDAQKEVKTRSEADVLANLAPDTVSPDEQPQKLLDENVDQEIDDIFSNLAPSEAQQQVTREALSKLKGDEPTGSGGEMSFAPPEESEVELLSKPEKFVDTLDDLPSVQPTAESLPINLTSGASELGQSELQSFAPPKSDQAGKTDFAPNLPSATAEKVMDLLESLAEQTRNAQVDASTQATENLEPDMIQPTETAASESSAKESDEIEETDETEIVHTAPKEIKEFGRLSAKSAKPGLSSETPGTMKTIGKLLLDSDAIENIIKSGETGQLKKNLAFTRVITLPRGEGIKAILAKIDAYPGVVGSVIVGHDGLIIASTLASDKDKDTLGVLAVACVTTSNLATRKLEIGKLQQMVMISDRTISVITDVDVGILGVFLDNADIALIDGLLNTIHDTIYS